MTKSVKKNKTKQKAKSTTKTKAPASAKSKKTKSAQFSKRVNKALNVVAKIDKKKTKIQTMIDLLNRPSGTSVEEIMAATGWQKHTVRGAISRATKKRGLLIASDKSNGETRNYKINVKS